MRRAGYALSLAPNCLGAHWSLIPPACLSHEAHQGTEWYRHEGRANVPVHASAA